MLNKAIKRIRDLFFTPSISFISLPSFLVFSLFISSSLFFTGCGPKNINHHTDSANIEGNRNYLISKYGTWQDGTVHTNEYLEELNQKLTLILSGTPNPVEIKTTLLNTETPLALSIGNNEIFLSRGMIKLLKSEGELFFVIAHEVAHDLLGHHNISHKMDRELKRSASPLTPNFEIEADLLALEILSRAGYPPMAALSSIIATYGAEKFLDNTETRSFIENDQFVHPSLHTRLQHLRTQISNNSKLNDPDLALSSNRNFQLFKNEL